MPASDDEEVSADEEWNDTRSTRRRRLECILLNMCGIMWQADNGLMATVYFEISKEFGVGPSDLGRLTLVRGVTEAIFSLPAGFMAEVKPRPLLIFIGILLWSAGIIGCGVVTTFDGLILCRMVNGAGLGLVQPLLLSLVSDTNAPSRRGTAFGLLQFTGNLGTMGGGYLSTILAPTLIMGMLGWRFVFIVFGMLSALVGIALVSFIGEPRKQAFNETSLLSIIRAKAPEMLAIMRIPTFLLIIGQGVAGTAPWFAFSYLSIWLELGCFSHSETAGINSFFVLGQAAAGLLGGKLLDVVASRYPDHGPAWLCQFSVGIGLPLFAFIFFGLKDNTSGTMMVPFCATFALAGSLVAWCGIANNKIFGDIVPQSVYTYVFSLDRAVEGAFGALGTPAVGLVTERVFSFDQSAVTSGACSPKDAASLGSGIFWVCTVCWSACFLFYCGLHYTYPRDRIRSQKQQVMLESSDSEDESSQSAGD